MCYYVGSGDSESSEVTSHRGSEPTLLTDGMISGNSALLKKDCNVSGPLLILWYLLLTTCYVSICPLLCQTRMSVTRSAVMWMHSACFTMAAQPVYAQRVLQVMDSCVSVSKSSSVMWLSFREMKLHILKKNIWYRDCFYLSFSVGGI